MAYPDLYNDESILLNAQNVKVKSVTFEAILTTKRLILVDSKKHIIAPQEILLATLRDVEGGENAIRDSTLSLSLITNSGATRQMILTFSKTSGGDRKRECDEWIRVLRQNLSPTFQHHAAPVVPEPAPVPTPEPVYVQETPVAPRIEIVNAPQPKKKIEIARPIKKIVEVPPAMPKPVETTSLPMGSFCNRCGNRVPPESVFCNRCGTPVVRNPDFPVVTEEPVPAPATPTAPAVPLTPTQQPQPTIPQLHVPIPPPVFGSVASERRERPIEQVIHSIEPLIADSVPRKEPTPLIQKPGVVSTLVTHTEPEPAPTPSTEPTTPPADGTAGVPWPVITPSGTPPAAPEPALAATEAGEPAPVPPAPAAAPSASPETPEQVPPPVPPAPKSSTKKFIAIAVAAIVILAVIGAAILFTAPPAAVNKTITPAPTAIPSATPSLAATPVVTPTETMPVMTTATTPIPTTAAQSIIPSSGVWVRVKYAGNYAASIGTPGYESAKSDTGDHVYQVPTSTGIVVASVQKVESNGQELLVEVYKDGTLVTKKMTTAPKGIIEIQVDLKPPTPTPTKTTIATTATTAAPAAANTTAN